MSSRSANSPSIAERLRGRSTSLTKSERRIARVLFASNMMAGFHTVGRLARKAGVSGPTVLRLTGKLGFEAYADFQRALRAELESRLSSPLSMFESRDPERSTHPLAAARRQLRRGLDATLGASQAAEFDALVGRLRSPTRRIRLVGGRFTRMLAEILWAHLYQLRADVGLVEGGGMCREAAALDIGRRDLLVVFDLRRYEPETAAFARNARSRGAGIALITDVWLSPVAEFADHVLVCDVEYPSPFDTMVPCLALVEALVAALTARLGPAGRRRVARLEGVRSKLAGDERDAAGRRPGSGRGAPGPPRANRR